jgi:hypothetical protein
MLVWYIGSVGVVAVLFERAHPGYASLASPSLQLRWKEGEAILFFSCYPLYTPWYQSAIPTPLSAEGEEGDPA